MPDFVAALRSRYPMVDIEITVDVSHNLRESLLNRALDLAILMGPISEFRVHNIDLPDFELVWIRSADLPFDGDEASLGPQLTCV